MTSDSGYRVMYRGNCHGFCHDSDQVSFDESLDFFCELDIYLRPRDFDV